MVIIIHNNNNKYKNNNKTAHLKSENFRLGNKSRSKAAYNRSKISSFKKKKIKKIK